MIYRMFLMVLVLIFSVSPKTYAEEVEENITVAVMDFGIHPNAVPIDINIFNAGRVAYEYILQRLFESNKVDIVDRTLVEETLLDEEVNTTGIINPLMARKIGEILGVKYIVYGNVNDVTLSDVGAKVLMGGINVCNVKSHIIARVMDVDTGEIISAAKGEGKSKSSFVKVSGGSVAVIKIGTTNVTQDSVHNAIQQAAYQTADILIARLYGGANILIVGKR